MKKLLAVVALILAAGLAGYHLGMNHVIYDAELFCVEVPARNEDGAIEDEEMTIYLEIDDSVHEYGCLIG